MIIDGKDLILGRLATKVAKAALTGEEDVVILNAEQVVIVGKKDDIFAKYLRLSDMGVPAKGPFLHRGSDKIVRRTIRGMLPYKTTRGKEAFLRVKTFIGVPVEYAKEEAQTFEDINVFNTTNLKFVTIKQVSDKLGFNK